MTDHIEYVCFSREELARGLTTFASASLKGSHWEKFISQSIPSRGALAATWNKESGSELPELLVVRDEDYKETYAWLNSYFSNLAPISQWCRILTQSQANFYLPIRKKPELGRLLSPWVGAIIAECQVQAGGSRSLRDLSGSAAASTATYIAGRATAVSEGRIDFGNIARKHDDLSLKLRENTRPLSAKQLLPVWATLTGFPVENVPDAISHELGSLRSILLWICDNDLNDRHEIAEEAALIAADRFGLGHLKDCARGPQVSRVRSLDRVAEELVADRSTGIKDGIIGLAASFVDPDGNTSAELLKRHFRSFPTAPIWQGMFASALTRHQIYGLKGGLGRLVVKSLLASHDLADRPSCDISYEEAMRWITPGRALRTDVNGMSNRYLNIEIEPGVSGIFAFGNTENSGRISSKDPVIRAPLESVDSSRTPAKSDLEGAIFDLLRRVQALEEQAKVPQADMFGQVSNKSAKVPRTSARKKREEG